MAETMNAAVLHGKELLSIEQVARPHAAPGELVRCRYPPRSTTMSLHNKWITRSIYRCTMPLHARIGVTPGRLNA